MQRTLTECPNIAVLGRTGSVTRLAEPSSSASEHFAVRGEISDLLFRCQPSGDTITVEMSFLEVATRGDGASESTVELPFFVAVTRRGEVIEKKVFVTQHRFRPGQRRNAVVERLRQVISTGERNRASDYEILYGFQLERDELEYNLFR